MSSANLLLPWLLTSSLLAAMGTTTTLMSSSNPSIYGQKIVFTAVVLPSAATGKVAFYDGTTLMGTVPLAGGSAVLATSLLESGSRALKAFYVGDGTYASSTSAVVMQTVNPRAGYGFLTSASYNADAGANPYAIAKGDFNGDGKPDLAVANSASGNVSVLLGRGDGTFQSAVNYTAGSNPLSVAVADFNGDGKSDLVVANNGSNNLSVLLGNGDGTFQPPVNVSTDFGPHAVVSGDLNGDGKADLAVANSRTVSIILGNGDGSFLPSVNLPYSDPIFGGGPSPVALLDLNGDGKLDLVVAAVIGGPCPDCSSTLVFASLGNGDGTFQNAQAFTTSGSGAPTALAAGDFNRDGKLDIAAGTRFTALDIYLGNGDGTLPRFPTVINPQSWLGSDATIISGDFNGDGLTDLAVVGKQVAVFAGNGDGTFQFEPLTYSVGSAPNAVVAGDFNADGIVDLAFANFGSNNVSIFFGTANPAPAVYIDSPASGTSTHNGTLPISGWAISSGTPIKTVQVQVDGLAAGNATYGISRPDVCAAFPGRPSCPNVGFTFSLSTSGVAPGSHTISIVATDSAFLPQATSATVTVRLGGTAASSVALSSSANPLAYGQSLTISAALTPSTATGAVTFYDGANLLGTVPIAAGVAKLTTPLLNSGAHALKAFYGGDLNLAASTSAILQQAIAAPRSGSGFQAAVNYAAGATPYSLAAADFNGDGKLDLAVANNAGGNVSILLGSGAGAFRPAVPYAAGVNPYAVAAGDFNGDGKPDIVVVNNGSATISVLLGNGDGTFQAAVNYATGNQPRSVAIGDINGDGYADLAVANYRDSTVSVYLGRGNGTFETPVNYGVLAPGGGATSVALMDLNGDGRLDLAVGEDGQDFPGVFFNAHCLNIRFGNGDGTFQDEQRYFGESSPSRLVGADFNGDGRIDIAAAHSFDFQGITASAGIFSSNSSGSSGALLSEAFITATNPNALNDIAIGDFNGDGKPDLALAGATAVKLLLGNGDGTFQITPVTYAGNGPSSVVVADFDGDGITDIAIANTGDNNVSILLGVLSGPPRIVIDSPSPLATVPQGSVLISGWALDDATAISSVQVKVDGTAVGTAMYGISRPDVCGAFPGRPGCPNVGFSYSLNTSVLSNGAHTINVSASDSDATPDSSTAIVTIVVSNVPPTVFIDSPPPGSVLSGVATISGWAIDNTAISTVQVKVDGNVVGNATYGVMRPDVCAVFPGRPKCPNVGYTYALNTAILTAGPHVVTVAATDSDTIPDVGTQSVNITVASGTPSVYIDTPTAGMVLSGVAMVSGWAIDSSVSVGTPIASVVVKVDGTVVGTAVYGSSRSDVCVAYPNRPNCPNVGFTYALDTTKLSAGAHTLSVVATDSDGNPDSGSWTVAIQVSAPPMVFIDAPVAGATVAGTVTVSGWAVDNATAIGSVQVKVDGTVVGNATYGTPRPDVCAVYGGRPGCPNVGFVYQLNAGILSAGTHVLSVVATDSDGSPDSGVYSLTIMK